MIKKLKKIIETQSFNPNILGTLINPFYIARKGLAKHIRELSPEISGKILDVGCGTKPYKNFFKFSEYIGLEYDTGIDLYKKSADYFYDGKKFPFNAETFDSIICNQVLEHVFEPEDFLKEIFRVLKPHGKLLITVPFVWDEHEQPFDYARYSSFGLKYLLEKCGFRIIKHKKSINNISVIFQLLSDYFYKISNKQKLFKWVTIVFIIFPLNLIGIILGIILPNNNDLFLDNIILAEKL